MNSGKTVHAAYPLDAYSTVGHGGRFTLVIPSEEAVVGLTSMPDSDVDIGTELDEIVDLARILFDL